ncbi:hypothetical protein A2U01_0026283, partial [Trifolium medium]|nr:hypothetical protein [Trifolium medium]
SQTLFPEVFVPDENENWGEISRGQKNINHLILQLVGYCPLQLTFPKSPHILDLVCFFVNRTSDERTTLFQDAFHVVLDIITATPTQPQQQFKLKRCALRLLTAGVTIKVKLPEDKDNTGFSTLSCFCLVWNSLCHILFWLCNIFVVKGQENYCGSCEDEQPGTDGAFPGNSIRS